MDDTRHNLQRKAFAEAVNLDFWHDPFGSAKEIGVYADVVFGTARVGGEAESKIRFRLSIKKAEVVLVISETEPVSVLKGSLARIASVPESKVVKKETVKREMKAKGKLGAKAGTASGASGEGSFEAGKKVEVTSEQSTERTVSAVKVTLAQTSDGHYCWRLEADALQSLDGRPWTVEDGKPHIKLVDQRQDIDKGIEPAVHMEVRCRREDIDIFDIELKDENLWDVALETIGLKNRLLAAEAYIRNTLCKEGLDVENISDKFGRITFCSNSANPSKVL